MLLDADDADDGSVLFEDAGERANREPSKFFLIVLFATRYSFPLLIVVLLLKIPPLLNLPLY